MLALDARTGERIWHFQGLRHDLWDRDFPAAPALVTVHARRQAGGRGRADHEDRARLPVRAHEGHAALPHRGAADAAADARRASGRRRTQPFPALPPPFARQQLDRRPASRDRTPEAHAAALKTFNASTRHHDPVRHAEHAAARSSFPAWTAAASGAARRSTRATGLLYVNSNEMAWLLKLVPRSDESLYAANCASCHGEHARGHGHRPVAARHRHAPLARPDPHDDPRGHRPHAGLRHRDRWRRGERHRELPRSPASDSSGARWGARPYALPYRTAFFDIFLDHEGYPGIKPPWGTLNAIDLNAGEIRWSIPFGEYPKLAAQGHHEHRHRQLRRRDRDGERAAVHRRHHVRQQDPRLRQGDGTLLWEATLPAAGNATPSTYMVNGQAVHRDRLRRRQERRAERRHVRGVRAPRGAVISERRSPRPATR